MTVNPYLADPDWLRDAYLVRGLTMDQIGQFTGVSQPTVSKALAQHGIAPRPPGPGPAKLLPADLDSARALSLLHHDQRLTVSAIAKSTGVTYRTVRAAMARHEVEFRQHNRPPLPPPLDDPEWLRDAYQVRRLTRLQVAAETGHPVRTVKRALHVHKTELRPVGSQTQPLPPPLDDPGWLRDAYQVRRLTRRQVAAEAGCLLGTVDRALFVHGIRPADGAMARHRNEFLGDRAWLVDASGVRGLTQEEIAVEAGTRQRAVSKALARHGIGPRRVAGGVPG